MVEPDDRSNSVVEPCLWKIEDKCGRSPDVTGGIEGYRDAAVEKYWAIPPIISRRPLWTSRLIAAANADTSFPSTRSSCD